MDEDEDYDSDSTVVMADFYKNPEKIARKRRKLDATLRRASQTNTQATNDAKDMVPNVSSENVARDKKRDSNNAISNSNVNRHPPKVNETANNSSTEDLKVKQELLKQANNDSESIKDCVEISDDSDDDCRIIDDDDEVINESTNLKPALRVLPPSTKNARKVIGNKAASKFNETANQNEVKTKITVLKPATINARRSTFNSLENNVATSKNINDTSAMKHTNVSSTNNKKRKSNDNNKASETVKKRVVEPAGLSGYKSCGDHPPKRVLTKPKPIQSSSKRNSDAAPQEIPDDLQPGQNTATSKTNDICTKENADVIKKAKLNKSTASGSVNDEKHSNKATSDIANVGGINAQQAMSGIQREVDTEVINSNDPDKTEADHDKTAAVSTVDSVSKDATVTNDNKINSDVVLDGWIFININKSTDAKRVTVDKQTLSSNPSSIAAINKTTRVENIVQNLKGIIETNNVQQIEDTGVLDDSNKANEPLSTDNKSDDAKRVLADTQTLNNVASCSNVAINTNSSKNTVEETLINVVKENMIQQTETGERTKDDEEVNDKRKEQITNTADHDQETNPSQIGEVDETQDEIVCDETNKRATEFQVDFFTLVKEYLEAIFQKCKKVTALRASPDTLRREIEHILQNATPEIQYACPKCAQVSVYTPQAMRQIGDDNDPSKRENNTLKCKLCRGLKMLHTTCLQEHPETSGKNDVSIEASENQNKARRTSTNTETSAQSLLTERNQNDTAINSSDKAKLYKRPVDADRYPVDPKRVRTGTDKENKHTKIIDTETCKNQTELSSTSGLKKPSSSINQPSSSSSVDHSGRKNISNNDGTEDTEERQIDKSGSGDEIAASKEKTDSKVINALVDCFTQLTKSPNTSENNLTPSKNSSSNEANCASRFAKAIETLIQTKNKDDVENTVNVQYTCSVCTCVYPSQASLLDHTREHHSLSNAPPEESNTGTDANLTPQQNKAKGPISNEGKQYECSICKEVLYSSSAANNHRKQAHKDIENYLTNMKLFNVTTSMEKGDGSQRASVDSQSAAYVEDVSDKENCPTLENEKERTKQATESLVSNAENRREENGINNINQVAAKRQDDIEKGHNDDQNSNNDTDQIKIAQNSNENDGERVQSNQEKETQANSSNGATGEKSKTKKDDQFEIGLIDKLLGELENDKTKAEKVTKLHETRKYVDRSDSVEKAHVNKKNPKASNKESFDNLHPKNTSIAERSNLPDENVAQSNVDERSDAQVEEKMSLQRENEPSNGNCRTNFDINDNQECVPLAAASSLYNCFSCGANLPSNGDHQCTANENNSCIANVQITNVVTVPKVYVFKCQDCNCATDVYDDMIRHCQNHYNDITDPAAPCATCHLSYTSVGFVAHQYLHDRDIQIITYSYKSLFFNWDTIFNEIPKNTAKEFQLRSIYKSHCVRMRIIRDGPWQYSLYQCSQCETCVAPDKVDQHCHEECYSVSYPCSLCKTLFPTDNMCASHERDHRATKQFRVVEFNRKKDERFNNKLFAARKLEMESRMQIADIYKCQCDLYFVSNESLKKHFVSCNLESDKGIICPNCAAPRLFESRELENHIRLHHSSVTYRFRVNRIVIQQEIEPFDGFNRENARTERTENDIKKELLKKKKG